MPRQQINIHVTDWQKDKGPLAVIRRRVFIEEQQVPETMEWDELDESCIHFLVTQGDQAVACARLVTEQDTIGRIGRMAVLPEYRNQGIGNTLLRSIQAYAIKIHLEKLVLHAQVSAITFYEKSGFHTCSDVFQEAGIAHREMCRDLC